MSQKKPAPLIPLPFRISDVIFSGIYLVLFANAAFFFLSECRQVPAAADGAAKKAVKPHEKLSLLPYMGPFCEKTKPLKLDLAFELDATWQKEVFPAEEDRVLKLVGSVASLLLCLPLSLVMIIGVRGNAWQRPAIAHATILLVSGIHAFNTGSQAQPKEKEVFLAAYLFMIAAPLALLHRWWGEENFTYSKTYSGVRGAMSLAVRVVSFFGLIFVATCVFDWAVGSHKELHGIPRSRPLINKYSAATTEQLYTFWTLVGEKLELLGKDVIAKIKEFQK